MIQELNQNFGIKNTITFEKGAKDLIKAVLKHQSGSSAEIYLYAAHITSWKDSQGIEQLFLSKKAEFGSGKAIRGGIPIIFPQFGGGKLPSHGFARNENWIFDKSVVLPNGVVFVSLSLEENEQTLSLWPHKFEITLEVELSETLLTRLIIKNTDTKAFEFQEALHTYFKVSDIHKVRITDLKHCEFLDNLLSKAQGIDDEDYISFTKEFDKIYLSTPELVHIVDEGRGNVVEIAKTNFKDSVVWNPWVEKSKGMKDMHENAYKEMLCVESANTFPKLVLEKGETHTAEQILRVRNNN